MNYTDKIEAYTTGRMSALEQLVFEQELAEDGALKEALEAHQLTEALLGFTANNLSEAAILGNTPVSEPTVSTDASNAMYYYGAGFLALCLSGLFAFFYTSASKTAILSPTIEAKPTISTPTIITIPDNQTAKETIIFQDPIQEVQPVPKSKPIPKAPKSKIKTKKSNKPRPVATIQQKVSPVTIPIKKTDSVLVNLSSSKPVNNGEAIVFTAGESITFEPGFVAEAGSSVQAVIEDKDLDR